MGAGLSGIDAAHHLNQLCPSKTYIILEQRERIGGTWDLFRYPGIRSDSDMLTMGYSFRPWTLPRAISPGEDIREYIENTARDEGIDKHIRFGHTIQCAAWSSQDARWTVTALHAGAPVTFTCNFLFSCAGYYRYSSGYTPDFPGIADFQGRVVHPQLWPEDLEYAGKRVVIIGSGATAVTLVPSMAETAAHVTMLQRSPTYVVSAPAQDRISMALKRLLPAGLAYTLSRWKNILFTAYFYQLSQVAPNFVKKAILDKVRAALPAGYDVATHFTPSYKPWEQRMCLVPDADLFECIQAGRASVVTGHIETIAANGVVLKSGELLEADIIVTATGLVMQAFGGVALTVDGRPVELPSTLSYKGVMFSGIPNLAAVFGYINASWTLKADLICSYVCRLLNHMDRNGFRQVTPARGEEQPVAPFVENFSSGYMQRTLAAWPKQGAKAPWRVYQNYFRDILHLRWKPVNDRALQFSK
jgi:cation diffusion facilitator CzcD-associated flavoprotein CzcO